VDRAAVGSHTSAQRIEIELLQCALRFGIDEIVRDEQIAIYQVNISLDTTKSVFQCVEQWARMLVVVVRVRAPQRLRSSGDHGHQA